MERAELVDLLLPLALSMRAEIDKATWAAYHRVLKDIPVGLLRLAVDEFEREPRRFFPAAGEFRAAAERQRRAYLAAHPYDGCAECEDHLGFRKVLTEAGQPTVEPCPCKARWAERLADHGIAEPLAALPGEAGVGENEQVYPKLEQLPAPIRERLTAIAAQKRLV